MKRVLIANRGEIAVRVMRACRERRLETVAVCSEWDTAAPHALAADRRVTVGPAPAAESYLRADRILEAAKETGADAIHPGYGFLSENADFADACAAAGITFIGPPARAIRLMGSKIAARELMRSAGVPIVPGETPRDQTDEGVLAALRSVGFPALVKAAAGGGGKGMRLASSATEAPALIAAARREALSAFGDGSLYVEKLVERPRHVEIQVFADGHGNVVHLFERECSAQRRHQKVLEESPSPALSESVRRAMGDAAIAAARAAGYRNAGTVEFLLEEEGDGARFYFLEMNTRLQVEHPVTEALTGRDLVHAQLAVAAGETLPWTQEALERRGHALECRVYAEDPARDFLPQAGPLLVYREPRGPGIRVDSGVVEGGEVPVHYDPLIAKLIVHAETRCDAIARARAALSQFAILGVRTNVPFLIRLLDDEEFRAGRLHTRSIDDRLPDLLGGPAEPPPYVMAVASAIRSEWRAGDDGASAVSPDPWQTLEGWR
jgi:acetyl-CoA carboxylase biotin carboxylase subunit